MIESSIESNDFEGINEFERKTKARQMFMYSPEAVQAGCEFERVYILHPAINAALQAFDRAFQLGRSTSLPQGLCLIGEPGTGKSSLIKYFKDALPASTLFEHGMGAISIRVQDSPNAGRMVSSLLRALRYPFANTCARTISIKKDLCLDALAQKNTRILFIDEAHNLCRKHTRNVDNTSGTSATEFVREIIDSTGCAVVLAGTSVLDQLESTDHHLANRIRGRFELTNFKDAAYWTALITAFVKRHQSFPLEHLTKPASLHQLHEATKGNLRLLKTLVAEGIMVAVDAKHNALAGEFLATAFQRVMGENSLSTNPFTQGAPSA